MLRSRSVLLPGPENTARITQTALCGLFPVKGVADVLGVVRSNLVEQTRGGSRSRGLYRRADDDAVLIAIRAVTDVRPTYGYRRVTVILSAGSAPPFPIQPRPVRLTRSIGS